MSTTSIKQIETLKGVFNVPKMNSRRNFLRENKLSLRELQRVTSRRQLAKEQQQEQQQRMYLGRRCASQQRSVTEQPQINSSSRCPSCSRLGGGSSGGGGDGIGSARRRVRNGSIGTVGTVVSKTLSCDKEIQTEDIHDEDFLYDALKKCASNECQSVASSRNGLNEMQRPTISEPSVAFTRRSTQSIHHANEEDAQTRHSYYPDRMVEVEPLPIGDAHEEISAHPHEQLQSQHQHQQRNQHQHQQHYQQNYNEDNYATSTHHAQQTRRSFASTTINGMNGYDGKASMAQEPQYPQHHTQQEEELKSNFEHLTLQSNCGTHEGPLSERSRRTNVSHELSKKRSTGSVHKLGSRDDVRLPRYLEREKREREEQRAREMERDVNCPLGHYPLTTEERKKELAAAESKFQSLISELNHMPMTTETLRIRNRKAEIEKELKLLENDIRIYSKSKVYKKEYN